jgi:hypothetical protein
MNTIGRLSLTLLVCLTVSALPLYAGAGNRTGTNGASELLIPVGTRDIALGGATASTSEGVGSLFWNPAASSRIANSASLYVSHMSYIADIGVDYGAVTARFGDFGVISLSLKSLSVGDIDVTTTRDPDGTGEKFSPQFFTIGLTYARQLSERVGVGITTHIISERIAEVSATGVAFDVGVLYDNLASLPGLSMGIVVKNIGPQMTFEGPGLLTQAAVADQNRPPQFYQIQAASFELPSTFELGFGYRRALDESNSILLTTTFQSNNFAADEYRGGLEYSFQKMFFLRAGYAHSHDATTSTSSLFGPAFGAGFRYTLGSTEVSFDYAYRAVKVFSASHIFSVQLGF